MATPFVEMLDEPVNTLGRTEEAVELILGSPERIHELYDCYYQPDEWARLRASSAFKRLWKKNWLLPQLKSLSTSHRKSVAKRATKWLDELSP